MRSRCIIQKKKQEHGNIKQNQLDLESYKKVGYTDFYMTNYGLLHEQAFKTHFLSLLNLMKYAKTTDKRWKKPDC